MKVKFLIVPCLLALAGSFALTSGAQATPTATSSIVIKPQGPIYKEVPMPIDGTFNGTITPGPTDSTVDGLMESNFKVPDGLEFDPDPKMPTCTFTESEANVPPDTARAKCPKAIVGNGVSAIYIAQSVAAYVTDPIVTIFNGPPRNGHGFLVMQAWSNATNQGIVFTGEIKDGVLDVKIPRLTFDSGVANFSLSIPGTLGQDKSYSRITCATGEWTSSGSFVLGDRDANGNVSNRSVLNTEPSTQPCTGLKGNAKFGGLKVKGPKKVKSGKKGAFKVTVTNKGTATSKKGTVKASGAGNGKASLPAIKPGASKTVTVKAKVKGKKGKKVLVKFKASGGASASGKLKVKVG